MILENLTDRCGANVNIAIVLAKQLSKVFEVHALVRYNDMKQICFEKKETFNKVHSFYADQPEKLARFTSNDWSKIGRLRKVIRFCKRPGIFVSMINAKYYDFSITKKIYKNKIEELCKKEMYDVVFAVSAPYYIMQSVAEANISYVKMALQLDPFINNYTLPSIFKKRRKRIENNVLSRINVLFAPDFVYKEINSFHNELNNVVLLPLPGIVVDKLNTQIQFKSWEKDYGFIHFVFVGQFYEKIRNPNYLLTLFSHLPNNYILHIVGGGCEQQLIQYKKLLKDRLILHGWVSKEDADKYISQYDVLVNVNNSITNQMPSKLFEYIGTGKPILNICKTDKCLSLPYIEKYENAISIIELDEMIPTNIVRTIEFIDSHASNILKPKKIFERFKINTDVYVAEIIKEKILKEGKRKKNV